MKRNRGDTTHISPKRRRAILLGLFWITSYFFLTTIFRAPQTNPSSSRPISIRSLPENEFGSFSFSRFDPGRNGPPIDEISFDHLRSSCSRIGFFRTAACRETTLTNLKLSFYSDPPFEESSPKRQDNRPNFTRKLTDPQNSNPPSGKSFPKQQDNKLDSQKLTDPQIRLRLLALLSAKAQSRTEVAFPQCSNTVKVIANGFEATLFNETDRLNLKSRRAVLTPQQTDALILTGHVTIQSGPRTLEASRVLWDLTNQEFIVDGAALLQDDQSRMNITNVRLDSRLNIQSQQTPSDNRGTNPCLVKI